LAASEWSIGRDYLKRGEQVAAIHSGSATGEREDQTTSTLQEALASLVEAYLRSA